MTAMVRAFLLVGLTLALNGYGQTVYSGEVVDADSGEPIPFVNIGVPGRGLGTVSDEHGQFLLELLPFEVESIDVLRLSSLGYEPREIPLLQLSGNDVYRLEPEPIALSEVVVSTSELYQVEEEIGYPDLLGKGIGYWKDSVALGGELASLIRVGPGNRKLNALFFELVYNPSDSVRLRINFYEPMSGVGYPIQNLNQSGKNILYTLKKSSGLCVVDLEPYDIWVKDDFVVSLELLAVYGTEKVGLSLPAGSMERGQAFRRFASQDSWERIKGSVVGYYFQSTLFTEDKRRLPKARIVRKRMKNEKEISGFVFYANRPVKGAQLRNYTRNVTTNTDERGRYRTTVSRGDVLGITYPGLPSLVVEIEDPKNFNFQLPPGGN